MEKNTYKIKDLKLKNFAKFENLEIEFNDKITHLVGVNGSGKSSILTAIWAGLKGISENDKGGQLIGDRFKFIGGKGKSADIEITLVDTVRNAEIKVRNHITEQTNKITFTAPEGYKVDSKWLDGLLSAAFLSAKNFTLLDGRKQAVLLGIDTKEFDIQLEALKEEFTLINREIRNIGELVNPGEVVKVSVGDLVQEKDKIDRFNLEQNQKKSKIENNKRILFDLEGEKKVLEEKLNLINIKINENKILFDSLPVPLAVQDNSEILDKIRNAETINTKADEYNRFLVKSKAKELKEAELNSNKLKQGEVVASRLDYIKNFNFGFEGLDVDEKGGLTLNGRPLKEPYFSKGEFELIVAELYRSINPSFKVRFLDDLEVLDNKNRELIINKLLDAGFQVITAEVGDEIKTKENTILLRECKVASDEKKVEKKQTLI